MPYGCSIALLQQLLGNPKPGPLSPVFSCFLVLLRTTKLAQSTSQYYFVLQSSHKVRPLQSSHKVRCLFANTTPHYVQQFVGRVTQTREETQRQERHRTQVLLLSLGVCSLLLLCPCHAGLEGKLSQAKSTGQQGQRGGRETRQGALV